MPPPPAIQAFLAKYPPPKTTASPQYVGKEVVKDAILKGRNSDFLILDLRKDDFVGGKIKGSFNIPVQSLYYSVDDLYQLAAQANKKTIYLHCLVSADRATRSYGWFKDASDKYGNKVDVKIIRGGIRDWIAGGKEYTDLMDEYNPNSS